MKQKYSLIIGVVALALVVAIAVSLFTVFDKVGNAIDDATSTETTKDTTSTSTEASTDDTSIAASYEDVNGFGYKTIGTRTYFYATFEIPEPEEPTNGDPYLYYYFEECTGYSYYPLDIKFSLDKTTWNNFVDITGVDLIKTEFASGHWGTTSFISDVNYGDTVYVSFCVVQNCPNPMTVFQDLKDNVFVDDDSDGVYDGFPIRIRVPYAII